MTQLQGNGPQNMRHESLAFFPAYHALVTSFLSKSTFMEYLYSGKDNNTIDIYVNLVNTFRLFIIKKRRKILHA